MAIPERWRARFAPVGGDPSLTGDRSFARLFDPASGLPDAALVVTTVDGRATAYVVAPGEEPRLVHSEAEAELVFGALPEAVDGRTTGEWREIPASVARSLGATSTWVVTTACLRRLAH